MLYKVNMTNGRASIVKTLLIVKYIALSKPRPKPTFPGSLGLSVPRIPSNARTMAPAKQSPAPTIPKPVIEL